jgi:hypothetical protein
MCNHPAYSKIRQKKAGFSIFTTWGLCNYRDAVCVILYSHDSAAAAAAAAYLQGLGSSFQPLEIGSTSSSSVAVEYHASKVPRIA